MKSVGNYAWTTTTNVPFEDAVAKITGFLKDEGFGILTEIDVASTLKNKLDVDYKPFKILGACNPPFAHRALQADQLVSVMMPCNVVVWDDGDSRTIAAMNPGMISQVIDHPDLDDLVKDIQEKIKRAISRIGE